MLHFSLWCEFTLSLKFIEGDTICSCKDDAGDNDADEDDADEDDGLWENVYGASGDDGWEGGGILLFVLTETATAAI